MIVSQNVYTSKPLHTLSLLLPSNTVSTNIVHATTFPLALIRPCFLDALCRKIAEPKGSNIFPR